MPRPLRFAPAGVPQHVRCRGNQQQDIFLDKQDHRLYNDLLFRHAAESAIRILGWCHMSNHVHLILQPSRDDNLSRMMQRLNSEYAQAIQSHARRAGHLWYGPYRASPMDNNYLWTALRYVELNPVRAGMVHRPEDWPWSSATAHMGLSDWPDWLDRSIWSGRWDAASWIESLHQICNTEEDGLIRKAARENRPLAALAVVERWEIEHGVELRPRECPRPKLKKDVGSEESQLNLLRSAAG